MHTHRSFGSVDCKHTRDCKHVTLARVRTWDSASIEIDELEHRFREKIPFTQKSVVTVKTAVFFNVFFKRVFREDLSRSSSNFDEEPIES